MILPPRDAEGAAGRGGVALRVAAATALPGASEIVRALRPLRRRVPSRRFVVLDEEATVRRVVDDGLWIPVLRPAPSRWLDVALVVDGAASMAIWNSTLAELTRLLGRSGAFRDVRVWTLDTESALADLPLFAGAFRAARGPSCDAREIADPTGRRLVLVMTDAVTGAWRDGRVSALLREWGSRSPTAIIDMLPEYLWQGTAVGAAPRARARAPGRGARNIDLVAAPLHKGGRRPPKGMAVPVLLLEPDLVADLASFIAGSPDLALHSMILEPGASGALRPPWQSDDEESDEEEDLAAAERIRRFKTIASPSAQRLARLFAASSLSLPVMRLIRQTMLPEATNAHIAEVLLGGLLQVLARPEERPAPDEVEYDFHEGVREALLATLPVSDSMSVLRRVSSFLQDRFGDPVDFSAMLADPAAEKGPIQSRQARAFAQVAASVLWPLGGDLRKLAERLEARKPPEPPQERPKPEPPPAPAPAKPEPSNTAGDGLDIETPEREREEGSSSEEPWRFNGQWIWVVGTGGELSRAERLASEAIAKALASVGYGLISGGYAGVDLVASNTYEATLRSRGVTEPPLLHVVGPGQKAERSGGRVLRVGERSELEVCAARARAIVLLGGKGWPFLAFRRCRELGKLAIPVGATGGDARRAYAELTGGELEEADRAVLRDLDGPLSTREEARGMAARIVERLEKPDKEAAAPDPNSETGGLLLAAFREGRTEEIEWTDMTLGDLVITVASDAMKAPVGDRQGVRLPVSYEEAVEICRELGCISPTQAMADAMFAQAQAQLGFVGLTRTAADASKMSTLEFSLRFHDAVEKQLAALGPDGRGLVAGAWRLWLLHPRLAERGAVNYGFWDKGKKPPRPVQTPGAQHDARHYDYSQLLQPVKRMARNAKTGEEVDLVEYVASRERIPSKFLEAYRPPSTAPRYEDLKLSIREHAAPGEYPVSVEYDRRVAENMMLLPRWVFEDGPLADRAPGPETANVVLEHGRALFDALFADQLVRLYEMSRQAADSRDARLRISLRIEARDLAAIPWESLHDRRAYLGLESMFSRQVNVPFAPKRPAPVRGILRMLAAVSSPVDLPALDLEQIRGGLRAQVKDLEDKDLLRLEWLPVTALEDVYRSLLIRDCNIVYFQGHLDADSSGKPALLLGGERVRGDRVEAERFSLLLDGAQGLRLVVLHLDVAGTLGDAERAALAEALVQRGISAVIILPGALSDTSAHLFLRRLLAATVNGDPVDEAVRRARSALFYLGYDWAAPVLYLGSSSGTLFDFSDPHER